MMVKRFFVLLLLFTSALGFTGCKSKTDTGVLDRFSRNKLAEVNRSLTQVIISDVFSPPVCSRIYAYCNIAAYEALVPGNTDYVSYAGILNQLTPAPTPPGGKDSCYLPISSEIAFTTVAQKLVFNTEAMKKVEDDYLALLQQLPIDEELKNRSVEFGRLVGKHIIAWASKDGYLQRNANPGFLVTKDPARWQPTPPDYMDAVEPNWGTLRPFTMDSSSMFRAIAPMRFDSAAKSEFYHEATIVYEAVNKLNTTDTSIARYWDCNPNVSFTSGHISYFQQQISPGGHWMHIAASLTENEKVSDIKAAEIMSKVAISLADAFISCWEAKYAYNTVRPETYINRYMDKDWKPFIQTPPFPEYPSGHSAISASAASMLTHLFGDNYAFTDSAEAPFGRPAKHFNSFHEAAQEASRSRLLGGIHFLYTLNRSAEIGSHIGDYIAQKMGGKQPEDLHHHIK